MKAILWARVSDPRRNENERHQDVENQLLPLRAAAARHGWSVVAEYRVEGSAWNKDPVEKTKLLDQLKQGAADVLAVWDVDRWSRREPIAVLQELVDLERHLGVHFFSLNQPVLSTATLDPGLRQALIGIYAWLNEAESRKRSERVKAAVASKRARAGNIGQNPKWGRGKIPGRTDVEKILKLRNEHPEWSLIQLGREVGFSRSTVYRVCKAGPGQGDTPPPVSNQ